MRQRSRLAARASTVSVLVTAAFLVLWFVGQQRSSDPALHAPALLERLYPGSWGPVARGIFWLIGGASVVWFDRVVGQSLASTPRSRMVLLGATLVAGLTFFLFGIASFAGADWTIVH